METCPQKREGSILENKQKKIPGEQRRFPEANITKEEDLGRAWTTAASEQVREEEHKTDFSSMKDGDEWWRENASLCEKLSNILVLTWCNLPCTHTLAVFRNAAWAALEDFGYLSQKTYRVGGAHVKNHPLCNACSLDPICITHQSHEYVPGMFQAQRLQCPWTSLREKHPLSLLS